jgi:hypothetical protein
VRDFLSRETRDWFFGPVSSLDGTAPSPGAGPVVPLEPESAYVALYAESMRVGAPRVRGQTFYATVASTCTVQSRTGQRAEVLAVSTPASLRGVELAHLDRVVVGRVPLIRPVPYRGGGVEAEIGVFAFPADYLMGPYLDLLGDVAAVAGAFLPPVTALAATALAAPVRKGFDLLFGATTNACLEIGLVNAWTAPVTGYYAVVRGREPAGGFRVRARRLVTADGAEVSNPHLVLRLEAQRERHDWAQIPDVQAAYQIIADAVKDGDLVAARGALTAFRRIAVLSPDLLADDGLRLHGLVVEEVRLALPGTGTSGDAPRAALPELADIGLYDKS